MLDPQPSRADEMVEAVHFVQRLPHAPDVPVAEYTSDALANRCGAFRFANPHRGGWSWVWVRIWPTFMWTILDFSGHQSTSEGHLDGAFF